jgi:hypothetical protein
MTKSVHILVPVCASEGGIRNNLMQIGEDLRVFDGLTTQVCGSLASSGDLSLIHNDARRKAHRRLQVGVVALKSQWWQEDPMMWLQKFESSRRL